MPQLWLVVWLILILATLKGKIGCGQPALQVASDYTKRVQQKFTIYMADIGRPQCVIAQPCLKHTWLNISIGNPGGYGYSVFVAMTAHPALGK